MSTFLGLIDEIPGISVDRFNGLNLKSSIYFLSHCHTDHMEGLSVNFFINLIKNDKYLYCSPISKQFLLGIYPGSPQDRIIEIELSVPKVIDYKITKEDEKNERTTSLTVTTSPAGHCPGSVMFIFEKEEKLILYTGDFRINPLDLPKLNPLNNKIDGKNRAKKFAAIYLDTTFLNSDFPRFPTRKESCEEISKAIRNWLLTDRKNIVIIECSGLYGAEYLFMEISKLLKSKIHVKDKVHSNYNRIKELAECATGDGWSTRIHACTSKMTREKLSCRSDVDSQNILTVVPSVQRWRGKSLSKFTEIDSQNNRRLYVCYSMHASYEELRAFVHYFKPDKIFPCVCPVESMNEIHYLIRELMSYEEKSLAKEDEGERFHDFKLQVPIIGDKNISRGNFKSKYFNDDDEEDDC